MIYISATTTNIETNIPIPKPVLNIPSTTEQLVAANDAKRATIIFVNLFFMKVYFYLFLQIS